MGKIECNYTCDYFFQGTSGVCIVDHVWPFRNCRHTYFQLDQALACSLRILDNDLVFLFYFARS